MPSAAWTASKTLAASLATSAGLGAEHDLGRAFDVAVAGLGGVGAGARSAPAVSASSAPLELGLRRPSSRRPRQPGGRSFRFEVLGASGCRQAAAPASARGAARAASPTVRGAEASTLGRSRSGDARLVVGDDRGRDDDRGDGDGSRAGESSRRRGGSRPQPLDADARSADAAGRERRGKPAAARSSSSAANSGRGVGRSAAQLGDQLVVVPKGLHRMPPSAWSRLGAAWCRRSTRRCRATRGDLGVGEAGEELERDQLALARRRAAARAAASGEPPLARLGALVRRARRARSAGSAASSAWRPRRRSSSRAALRAIPNSQARGSPRPGSKRERLR